MVFLVGGANSASDFEIENSLRFNDNDSAYLSITPSSAGNRRTFTYSGWIKVSYFSATSRALLSCGSDSGSNDYIMFQSGDRLRFSFGTEGNGDIITTRLFRDPSAWYHIVWAVDTTQGTASDRVKLYVNGTLASDISGTYPDQNYDTAFNNTEVQRIGARAYSATQYYDGYMADVYLIDGAQKAASDFGETDDNGVWVPKKYTGTYGTNGFKLEFKQTGTSANASGIGADTSGNGNHLTPTNLAAVDVCTDTPSNNFATLNPHYGSNSYAQNDTTRGTFTEGNCNFSSAGQIGGSERYYNTTSTIAIPPSGKWYWEAKPNAGDNGLGFRWTMGFLASNHGYMTNNFTEWTAANGQRGAYKADGTVWYDNSEISSGHGTPSVNDIISFKYDSDNRDLYVAVNGTYINSGNAVLTDSNIAATDFLLIFLQNGSDGDVATAMNFGNPPFSISSGNSDANGYGNFEYAVPSGYYALCTKNLGQYG